MHSSRHSVTSPPGPRPRFLSSYHHHRDLHSFPTRRSSDLFRGKDVPDKWKVIDGALVVSPKNGKRAVENLPRSEEHTSELQSRLHLVCRLLLEKKKHQTLLILQLLAYADRARPARRQGATD